jgi:hypothetical protein
MVQEPEAANVGLAKSLSNVVPEVGIEPTRGVTPTGF